jgi:uncharacterized protein
VHFLVVFIVLIMPIISWREIKKRRFEYSDVGKERTYWRIHFWYWLAITFILFLVPMTDLYYPKYPITFNAIAHIIFGVLIAYEFVTAVLPIAFMKYLPAFREKVAEQYDDTKRATYPVTSRQQLMFLFVSISVGIGEEIIFRGFLYNYLQDYFTVSAIWSFVIVSLYFGVGHFHQGISGIIQTTIFGLIMGYLYFTTGSLLVPIIAHILFDMRVVWLARLLETHKGNRPS